MSEEPKAKKPRKKKRKENKNVDLIKNLVEIPENAPKAFWARESKLAKELFALHGEDLLKLSFPKKFKSLSYLHYVDDIKDKIRRAVLLSQYVPDEYEDIKIYEKKSGKDAIIKRKPKNLRQWLDPQKPKTPT